MSPTPSDLERAAELLRPAWVTIDLDALEHNLEHLRRRVAPAGVLAVVKADAYGHGARPVARFLESRGVDWLGVALVEEGIELRRAGVRSPVLVLGPARSAQLPLFQRFDLTPAISSLPQLECWCDWAEAATETRTVHLKVDVGMLRLGLEPEDLPGALERVRRHPRLSLGGLLGHLADADELDSPRTAEQEACFDRALGHLSLGERKRVALHLANSAAALHHPLSRHSFVRTGLALFGLDPAAVEPGLRPVMSVASRIVQLKEVAAGARPGYGGLWTAPRRSLLALVPVGYADGYGRRLSNRASMLVRGRRAPVVGAVSMDMTLIDVTEMGPTEGEEVVLLGRQGEDEVTAAELARHADTIPYEVLCLLGLRLPRRYVRHGRQKAIASPLAIDPQ